jgi:hypothetical protein
MMDRWSFIAVGRTGSYRGTYLTLPFWQRRVAIAKRDTVRTDDPTAMQGLEVCDWCQDRTFPLLRGHKTQGR